MTSQIDTNIELFRWRLAETTAWCTQRLRAGYPWNTLRSSGIRPPALLYTEESHNGNTIELVGDFKSSAELKRIVDALAVERANQLRIEPRLGGNKRSGYPSTPASDLAGGRILLYYPYETLSDGASAAETQGFFDEDNVPPWDTWICFIDSQQQESYFASDYLVCWIPSQFCELASTGINVNPEQCIEWATDRDTPFTRQLKEGGLLE